MVVSFIYKSKNVEQSHLIEKLRHPIIYFINIIIYKGSSDFGYHIFLNFSDDKYSQSNAPIRYLPPLEANVMLDVVGSLAQNNFTFKPNWDYRFKNNNKNDIKVWPNPKSFIPQPYWGINSYIIILTFHQISMAFSEYQTHYN